VVRGTVAVAVGVQHDVQAVVARQVATHFVVADGRATFADLLRYLALIGVLAGLAQFLQSLGERPLRDDVAHFDQGPHLSATGDAHASPERATPRYSALAL